MNLFMYTIQLVLYLLLPIHNSNSNLMIKIPVYHIPYTIYGIPYCQYIYIYTVGNPPGPPKLIKLKVEAGGWMQGRS